MTLGDIVKQYREEHDLSQRQFAAACELSNGYISMLEKNENPKTGLPMVPSITAMKKIADVMGVALNDLMDQIDDMTVSIQTPAKKNKELTVRIDDELTLQFIEGFSRLPAEKKKLVIHQIEEHLSGE